MRIVSHRKSGPASVPKPGWSSEPSYPPCAFNVVRAARASHLLECQCQSVIAASFCPGGAASLRASADTSASPAISPAAADAISPDAAISTFADGMRSISSPVLLAAGDDSGRTLLCLTVCRFSSFVILKMYCMSSNTDRWFCTRRQPQCLVGCVQCGHRSESQLHQGQERTCRQTHRENFCLAPFGTSARSS
jgi:hypothetical protein